MSAAMAPGRNLDEDDPPMRELALRSVFDAERPMLLRLLVSRLGNREDAEDSLQDLWLKIDQIGDRIMAEPAAFLFRAAANLATDRRIAAARRSARDTKWLDAQPRADEYPDAERMLLARDRLRRVEAAMAAMPERMRTALIQFRFEGRSLREVAARLGITVSGVEKLLRRAYRKIHDAGDATGADMDAARRIDVEGSANDA